MFDSTGQSISSGLRNDRYLKIKYGIPDSELKGIEIDPVVLLATMRSEKLVVE
jgi:hypothetical protein